MTQRTENPWQQRTENLWQEFCETLNEALASELIRRAGQWVVQTLVDQGVPKQDRDAVFQRVLKHLRDHTFSTESLSPEERVDYFPLPEDEGVSSASRKKTERSEEEDDNNRRYRELRRLEMYVVAVTLYYWWHHESQRDSSHISDAAEALAGSLVEPLAASARKELKWIYERAPADAVMEAAVRAIKSLITQWSKPITDREQTTAQTAAERAAEKHLYWDSFPGTLQYARLAAKNKAKDVAKLNQTKTDAGSVTFQPESHTGTAPRPEKALEEQEDQEFIKRAADLAWQTMCSVANGLENTLSRRWAWLVLGGVEHTAGKAVPPRDQTPPGDKTAWLYQPQLVRAELVGRNAVRDILSRPIHSAVTKLELPSEIRESEENLTEKQWKNLPWNLFLWMGQLTAQGIVDGRVRTDLDANLGEFPQFASDGTAPTRDEVASWAKAYVFKWRADQPTK